MRPRWLDEGRINIAGGIATVRREAAPRAMPAGPEAKRFDSKTEQAYFNHLSALKFGGEIIEFWYHPFTLKLADDVRYTPDFLVQVAPSTSRLQIHEVKGWSKNVRDGITRVKIAASLYHCFDWRMVRKGSSKWEMTFL